MLVRVLVSAVVLLHIIQFSKSQVLPSKYTVTGQGEVNGSSSTGNCSGYHASTCLQPGTSVLFDGIPTLSRPSGNTWASPLLTLNAGIKEIELQFSINTVTEVEVVMFNCPEWGIGARSIRINSNSYTINTSCDYLVRTCIPCSGHSEMLEMSFESNALWVHIAEVTFYVCTTTTTNCIPGPIIPTPPINSTTDFMSLDTTLGGTTTTQDSTTNIITTVGGTNTNTTIVITLPATILLILVCVIASLLILLLWSYKHSKHNINTQWEGAQVISHPSPLTLGLSEETGQGQYSVMNNHSLDGSQENEYALINQLYTTVQRETRGEEDTGGYMMIPVPQTHSVAGNTESAITTNAATAVHPLHIQADNTRDIQNTPPEESIGIYSVITNPDPPHEYTKPNRNEDGQTTASHPPEDDTAMERLYTKVDKKKKREKTKDDPDEQSMGIYSMTTNPDPQSPANEESAHRESREGSAEDPEAEYSLVLPSNLLIEETFKPPQIPPKSDQLIDELNTHT